MKLDQERLGSFYLGAEYNPETGKRLEQPVHYDARDLTTHALCVGMTGSGKTGLCIGLLEEAALDHIPTIMIDPKGDITNLLLQFPDMKPEDFEPWINDDDARRKGMSRHEYAADTAETWRNGLADWGIGPERIQMLKESSGLTIYTPGSDAGVPISILGSLKSPKLSFEEHGEAIRERITGTVSALLGLTGIKADRIRSREAILLAAIFDHFWRQGEDIDLQRLILSIQTPPLRQIGVFDTDTFFPEKERFDMALAFNNLLASPGFQGWLEGESLDIDTLMYSSEGKPRQSIFYLAHLNESERMFFVTLLLENMLTWMRAQSGTTSLRALLYFDEVFGFLPPVSEPSSKRPLMTMLKQARAFGLGCVLVTQNPVDVDYKALTNTGTWFIGKLQAERDKARVLEGLKNAISQAGGNGDAVDYDSLITGLGSRVFLMHNIHEDKPVIFHTRWAMSYLRGPLTRPQVRRLMDEAGREASPKRAPEPSTSLPSRSAKAALASHEPPAGYSASAPVLGASLRPLFLPVRISRDEAVAAVNEEHRGSLQHIDAVLLYEPALLGDADVHFFDKKRGIQEKTRTRLLLPLHPADAAPDWNDADSMPLDEHRLEGEPGVFEPEEGPFFGAVPQSVNSSREMSGMQKKLADMLYYSAKQQINVHPDLDIFQHPDEKQRDFLIRLQQAARERRDQQVDKLEEKYAKQIHRLQDKLRKEERELAEDEMEHQNRRNSELIGIGETVLGFFMGRRSTRGVSGALNRRRMTAKAKADIEESHEEIALLEEEIRDLQSAMESEVKQITSRWKNVEQELVSEELSPRRTDIDVHRVTLVWRPYWQMSFDNGSGAHNTTIPACEL